jgi:inhibitor of cysteine peptidase
MAEVELPEGGSVVAIDVGDVLVVRVPQNATTGYLWHLVAGDGLTALGDETDSAATAPGSAGRRTFRVRADEAGERRVGLRLQRPWEDEVAEERRVDVTVR